MRQRHDLNDKNIGSYAQENLKGQVVDWMETLHNRAIP
jgi:hypothetical protein